MVTNDVVVITGSSCAGKTTVARALAELLPGPCAIVELDAVRGQIAAGALSVWSPFPPTDAALDQWATAIEICGDAARRYRARGWSCIIDAPGIYPDDNPWPPFRHSAWRRALDGMRWRLVVLHPTLEEVERRASARRGEPAQGDQRLAAMHGGMEAWRGSREGAGVALVDPTGFDPAASASLVLAALEA
jgi:chloramphenicol 3-O-phosphotransferase